MALVKYQLLRTTEEIIVAFYAHCSIFKWDYYDLNCDQIIAKVIRNTSLAGNAYLNFLLSIKSKLITQRAVLVKIDSRYALLFSKDMITFYRSCDKRFQFGYHKIYNDIFQSFEEIDLTKWEKK